MPVILIIFLNIIHWLLVKYCYRFLPGFLSVIGYCIYFLQLYSQLRIVIGNPGIPSKDNYISEEIHEYLKNNSIETKNKFGYFNICRECNILITYEKSISHCKTCGICIVSKVLIKLF